VSVRARPSVPLQEPMWAPPASRPIAVKADVSIEEPNPLLGPMTVTFSAKTDVGRVRDNNEDNFLVDRKLKLYMVCDGMGGHQGGEVASATAVNVVRETLLKRRDVIDGFEFDDGRYGELDVLALVEDAVHVANQRVFERGQQNPSQRGMGTTLSLLLLIRDTAFVAHVGDTRIYRLRNGELGRLTEDHTLVREMARSMNVAEDAIDQRLRNAITRAVGVHAVVEVDARHLRVEPGDRFLLSSDGLHGVLADATLHDVLEGFDDPVTCVDALIERANDAGGPDNITALLVQVSDAPRRSTPEERESLIAIFRQSPLFSALSELELRRLAVETERRALGPGEALVGQGRPLDALHVVIEGRARLIRNGVEVATLGRAESFGEDALLDDVLSGYGVRASKDRPLQLAVISPAAFENLRIEAPGVALKVAVAVARALAGRVQELIRHAPDGGAAFHQAVATTRPSSRARSALRAYVDTGTSQVRPRAQPRPAAAVPQALTAAERAPAVASPGAEPPPLPRERNEIEGP